VVDPFLLLCWISSGTDLGFFTGWMTFLMPNQQHFKSNEGFVRLKLPTKNTFVYRPSIIVLHLTILHILSFAW